MYRTMKNIDFFSNALDGLWLRNEIINHNISNANTPNYKKLTVNFEDTLKNALNKLNSGLNTTHENHISKSIAIDSISPTIIADNRYTYRIDGNNVNIDVESANLAKNAIAYNAVINQITGEFNKLKSVINEGR